MSYKQQNLIKVGKENLSMSEAKLALGLLHSIKLFTDSDDFSEKFEENDLRNYFLKLVFPDDPILKNHTFHPMYRDDSGYDRGFYKKNILNIMKEYNLKYGYQLDAIAVTPKAIKIIAEYRESLIKQNKMNQDNNKINEKINKDIEMLINVQSILQNLIVDPKSVDPESREKSKSAMKILKAVRYEMRKVPENHDDPKIIIKRIEGEMIAINKKDNNNEDINKEDINKKDINKKESNNKDIKIEADEKAFWDDPNAPPPPTRPRSKHR